MDDDCERIHLKGSPFPHFQKPKMGEGMGVDWALIIPEITLLKRATLFALYVMNTIFSILNQFLRSFLQNQILEGFSSLT